MAALACRPPLFLRRLAQLQPQSPILPLTSARFITDHPSSSSSSSKPASQSPTKVAVQNLLSVLRPTSTSAPRPASIVNSPSVSRAPHSAIIPPDGSRIWASTPASAMDSSMAIPGTSAAVAARQSRLARQRASLRGTIIDPNEQLFHLHIYSTKHNTHITFTDPKKNAVISCSTGNLGFRKAHRHTYDAAYQLAAHVFQKIEEKGLIPKMVEVILRGFGIGREACVKALLGKEGRYIKDVVVRVTDATRTKFGGTRSKKPRRL